MTLDFDAYAIMLVLSPFVVALAAPLIARESGRAAGWILAIVPAGLFMALLSLAPSVSAGQPVAIGIDWVPALALRLSLFVDGLSLVFALLITGIGAIILVYSGEYLAGHPQRGRFLALILAFMGAMLGLVLADSLVALFVFWELTSVASFLLIGFDSERREARRAAFQALFVTGAGGLALMAGGVVLALVAGDWNLSSILHSGNAFRFHPAYPVVLGLVLLAAFTKSAQVPFHFWLPNAMEAPTPVSAYLHSATMVQAGVYLLARLSPILGETPAWQALLCGVGGATLLWGSLGALHQVDLKQVLARTTVATLGLLVLLLGIGGEAGAMAMAATFVAHALYKAGLFLAAGIVDKQTGTRNPHALGGLRDSLTITFIAAALGGLSMFGAPPLIGYLAKEEVYGALGVGDPWSIAVVAAVVIGNGLVGAAALIVVVRPFLGPLKPTPKSPKEAPFALWVGPVVLGLAGLGAVFALEPFAGAFLDPMATAIAGRVATSHQSLLPDPAHLPLWLSIASWALAIVLYLRLGTMRAILELRDRRLPWHLDRAFDATVAGLMTLAATVTRALHHGRLELYLVVVVAAIAVTLLVPMGLFHAWPSLPPIPSLTIYEWGAAAMATVGIVAVVAARSRLGAIVALGVQGLALSLIFIFYGAPDLGFTQLMIEVLSVVILALVMTKLNLSTDDPRPYEDWLRDGALAIIAAAAMTLLLLRVLEGPLDLRLSTFFEANSSALAHGRNIVNVILVDFRGLDTLGEISVVMTAGICVLALLRQRQKRREPEKPKRTRGRKAEA